MSISLTGQTVAFLYSCVFGVVLGFVYDILRGIRLLFALKKTATALLDLLYFFLAAVFSFLFFLTIVRGELRGHLLFGEMIGWILYYESIGSISAKLQSRLVRRLRRYSLKGIRFVRTAIKDCQSKKLYEQKKKDAAEEKTEKITKKDHFPA